MNPRDYKIIYWLSPLAGICLQFIAFAGFLLWDFYPDYGGFLGILEDLSPFYFLAAGVVSVFTYAYLAIQAWLPRYYVALVVLSLTVVAGCSLYLSYHLTFWGRVTIREILDNILPLAKPLLWVSLYFLPVYIASHLYIRQKRSE